MARTFPQPEKKETPTQKLKRELAEAEAQRRLSERGIKP